MKTVDGYWRPGSKKAEELLSDTPTIKEKEAFIMAKLDAIFKNQVGDFTIFKAEMLDHFMLSIEEQTNNDGKEDFCKAYYKTYKELGGALMVRSMGYHSMHMSYRHLHRGFLYWWAQNKVATIVIFLILATNMFIFDLSAIVIKCLTGLCLFIIVGIMVKSYYTAFFKLKEVRIADPILSSYRFELRKVFSFALPLCSILSLANWMGIENAYVLAILMPLTYLLAFYYIYVESKFDDLTSNRTIGI